MALRVKIWLALSAAAAAAGAALLYPISAAFPAVNALFFLIKAGMLAGLAVLFFAQRRAGFVIWAASCAGAVGMACLKWGLSGQPAPIVFLSIAADILMPAVAFLLLRGNPDALR